MDWVLDDRGESLFTMEIHVEENREYQYKFKVGHGDDWDLDEQSPTSMSPALQTCLTPNVLILDRSIGQHGQPEQPAHSNVNLLPWHRPSASGSGRRQLLTANYTF
jgi:hypothetical protein